MDVVELVNKYGFPIVMAVGMGFIIKYVWEWATKEIKPVINDANTVLIALIDRIRMLDNDLIRLNQKVNTVLTIRGKMIESDRVMETAITEAQANVKFHDAMEEADKIQSKDKKNSPQDHGTTGVAAIQTNRKFIGIEMNQEYYDYAKQRIEGAVPVQEVAQDPSNALEDALY